MYITGFFDILGTGLYFIGSYLLFGTAQTVYPAGSELSYWVVRMFRGDISKGCGKYYGYDSSFFRNAADWIQAEDTGKGFCCAYVFSDRHLF